jgi:hypothetical protein
MPTDQSHPIDAPLRLPRNHPRPVAVRAAAARAVLRDLRVALLCRAAPILFAPVLLAAACCIFAMTPARAAEPAAAAHPVNIIFDTDMGNDVDDIFALAILHDAQDKGLCELLAVTLTTPDPLSAPYTRFLNRLCGRPGIPIGVNPASPKVWNEKKRFLKFIETAPVTSPADALDASHPPALQVLRRALATAPDASVVIVQVGAFTNLADLLRSGPDDISPLDGRALAARKVRWLSLMAGHFGNPDYAEFNVKIDAPSARLVAEQWPTPRVWSGFEIGIAVRLPAEVISDRLPPGNIARESYQRYQPVPHERPCWDLTSAFFAVHPQTPLLTPGRAGRVTVAEKGQTAFAADPAGPDSVLFVTPEQAAALRAEFARIAVAKFAPAK